MARAYYNEIEPDAVLVLRQLISDGVIAPGDVDDRSIKDVSSDDLRGYTQCHFFAGGGLWSVAARLAGWPDERPLWTGSCPCQPFSSAGRGRGTDDPRHLWPDFYRLIRAGRPPVVMGEQVAGKTGRDWFNGVRSDLEGGGYVGRAVDIPACAVDAPHQRNRLYWIAMADAAHDGRSEIGAGDDPLDPKWPEIRRRAVEPAGTGSSDGGNVRRLRQTDDRLGSSRTLGTSPIRPNCSWWSDAESIACGDGKTRRTQRGTRLLVDGLPGRVGLWRLAGNGISPVLAAEVIGAFLDAEPLILEGSQDER